MNGSWLNQVSVKAHLDRLRFSVEPISPMSREEFAAHIPGRARMQEGPTRWDLRDVGGVGERFDVTVHDPKSLTAITRVVDRIGVRVPLKCPPLLRILEVALDVWPKTPGSLDLDRVVADLFKGAKFEPTNNLRAGGGPMGATSLFGPNTPYRRLREGYTLYNGDRDAPLMVRAYPKRTDNGRALPERDHRARFEVQMMGEGLPVPTFQELGKYRFEILSPMFLMLVARDDLPPLGAFVAGAVPKLRRYPRTTRGSRQLLTRAFIPFNRRVYRALERLSISMQGDAGSPFHQGHLEALREHSVSTDSFFHPVENITPNATSESTREALTTLTNEEYDPAERAA